LKPGDTFGATGYNGGASGWEVDGLTGRPGEATGTHIIAQGANPGGGAVMALLPRPLGGFVFTSSSISFNGALSDPAISTIMSNVFTAALADRPAITTGHGLPRRAGQLLPSRPVAPRTIEGP
jgi:N,N-dimethylformamidase